MRTSRAQGLVWTAVLLGVAALVAFVANAPLKAALMVIGLAAAAALVWRYGAAEGLWLLFVLSLPYREPLSVDIRGTISLFPSDLLLFALVAALAARGRLAGLWKRSVTLRFGLAILALSVVGLPGATRFFWGVASIYRIVGQLAVFAVAVTVVEDGRAALRTLVALVAGAAPAVLYGLIQAAQPFEAAYPEWASHLIAYGPGGVPHLGGSPPFHLALRFSHFLSVVFGVALGLVFEKLSRVVRAFVLVTGTAAAYCNLFTYSIAGMVGMLSAVVATLFTGRRRAALAFIILAVAFMALSPTALLRKADRVLSGEALTLAARAVTYRQAVDIMTDHPLTGVGWGSIRSSLEYDYRITRAQAVAFGAENYFLQRGIALGIPGLLIAAAVLVLFLRHVFRSSGRGIGPDWPRGAILIGGAAFYVQAMSYPAADAVVNFVLWLFLALAERMWRDDPLRSGRTDVPATGRREGAAA